MAKLFIETADGNVIISCERNDSNEATHNEELRSVLPTELARVDMKSFVRTLQIQRACLKRRYYDAINADISEKFRNVLRAYRGEGHFKTAVLR